MTRDEAHAELGRRFPAALSPAARARLVEPGLEAVLLDFAEATAVLAVGVRAAGDEIRVFGNGPRAVSWAVARGPVRRLVSASSSVLRVRSALHSPLGPPG